MSQIFISYSRKDKPFVARLDAAMSGRGQETWVDWDDIRPSEDFMQAIFAAIDAADAVVFVLSPQSITSTVCGREVTHAVERRKRLIPLVCSDVDADCVPTDLAALNWIFAREGDDFEAGVAALVEAIEMDLAWVRAHARLLVRAAEWDGRAGTRATCYGVPT